MVWFGNEEHRATEQYTLSMDGFCWTVLRNGQERNGPINGMVQPKNEQNGQRNGMVLAEKRQELEQRNNYWPVWTVNKRLFIKVQLLNG